MTTTILIFIIANFINVVLNTAKSLLTVKGGIFSASFINCITFGFYTYIVFLISNGDINIHIKAIIIAIINFVGVALVKFVEKKLKKDRLWIFTATVKDNNETIQKICKALKDMEIKLIYNEIVKDELYTLQVFSKNQKESEMITSILNNYKVKYYAIESKID